LTDSDSPLLCGGEFQYQVQGIKGILSDNPCVPGYIPGGTANVKCNPFVNNYLQMDFF